MHDLIQCRLIPYVDGALYVKFECEGESSVPASVVNTLMTFLGSCLKKLVKVIEHYIPIMGLTHNAHSLCFPNFCWNPNTKQVTCGTQMTGKLFLQYSEASIFPKNVVSVL